MDRNMVSGVATIEETFNLSFDDKSLKSVIQSFETCEELKLAIPKYQREFTWEDGKIRSFIEDIGEKSKFLGIIALEKNEKNNTLDIVDGQQRITTLMLLFVCLYNNLMEVNERYMADVVLNLMNRKKGYILVNDSVKEFVHLKEGKLEILIKEENDIYYQKEKFEHASRIINKEFNIRKNKLNIDEWKKYLTQTVIHAQDCQMVIVINTVSKNEGSIEEIYIDINEKAQRLDEENIFKGYCFSKIKDLNQQELLKYKWTCIKKNFYGIKELRFKDLSSLLQMFLMIKKETTKITKNLHYEGKHYLANKKPTDVIDLLD